MVKKTEKVLAIIDTTHTRQENANTIEYALHLAKATARDLVFSFLGKIDASYHKELLKLIEKTKKSLPLDHNGKTYSYEVNVFFNGEIPFFRSINSINKEANAAFLVMGIGEEKKLSLQEVFGKTIWSIASNSKIPVILVPPTTKFSYFAEITIAADEENKVQKMNWVKPMYHKFGTKVHVFVKSTGKGEIDKKATTVSDNMVGFLRHEGIPNDVVYARNQVNFDNHLIKYAMKNTQLLIIEIDRGSLGNEIKKNIQKLLFTSKQQFAVMLVKTKDVGIFRWS